MPAFAAVNAACKPAGPAPIMMTVFVEVEATTTVANAWQEVTFDLTSSGAFNTAKLYDRVILFPDFGVKGTGAIYYFDDIKQSN